MTVLKIIVIPTPSRKHFFLNGGKIFSKIDLSEAYLQVKVDEQCPKYLTIHTYLELDARRRFLLGLKVALRLFQQIIDAMLAVLDYAKVYLDNIRIKIQNNIGNMFGKY